MATLHEWGGASAPPNILPFPQTKRALRHCNSGMDAAGFLSLLLITRDGEAIPANVVRFDEPDGPKLPENTPALMLALALYAAMPKHTRESVESQIRCMAFAQSAGPSVRQLFHLLCSPREAK